MYLSFYPNCNFWKLGYGKGLSFHGQIIDLLRLKKPCKIIKSNNLPGSTVFTTRPYPQMPNPCAL